MSKPRANTDLIFAKVINLTTSDNNIAPLLVRKLNIINEPNDELVQYYIDDNDLAEDKNANVVYSNYDELLWGNKSKRLTSKAVSRIGLKSFPGIGAIAYYKYKYEAGSFILCPVNNNKAKFTAPTLSMIDNGDGTLTFSMKNPKDITYECFRIVLSNQYFAIEHVTYEPSMTVPKPDVKGNYVIFCVGYVSEGQTVSFDSNLINLTITEGKDSFEPDRNSSYFTKEQVIQMFSEYSKEIDEKIGTIGTLIDTINGEVV